MWKFLRPASKLSRTGTSSTEDALQGSAESADPALSLDGVRRVLAARHARWIIVAIALALTSTSLTLGLTGDDYLHKLMVQNRPGIEGLRLDNLNLFTFASGDPEELRGLMNEGVAPWWISPHLRFVFFRPLSSLTHYVDYTLWPEQPVLMHLHSMLWFALLVLAVAAVQRRFHASAWVAGLATFLYAVDDARAAPVGWLSNRNAMIATIPALLALLAHDSWRRRGSRRAAVAAPLAFAVGLLGGEAGVQIGAYLLAYALFLDPQPGRRRLLSLAPYAVVIVLWRVVYFLGEYGVRGSALYVDPVSDPLHFVQTLAVRLPILLLAQFALPYAEFWDLFPVIAPPLQPAMLVLALVVVSLAIWLLVPLYRRDAQVRFWMVGTLLATIPACAAVPNDRLLTATGVGGAALIARFLAEVYERTYPRERRSASAAAAGLVAVHALFAPLALPFRTKAIDGLEVLMRRADKSIPSTPDIAQREVVILNPPADPFAMYFAGFREAQRVPRPHPLRWLTTGVSEIVVTRLDRTSIQLSLTDGFLANSSQWILRDHESYVGETVELDDCTIIVRSVTEDARPKDVEFRFREPLDSPRYVWMQWGRHEYVPFRLPAIGQSVTIPRVDMASALLGLGLTDA